MERGLIHIYCGDGKGKTTAALGLGLRACGRGLRVLLVRFLKDKNSGELDAIARIENFGVLEAPESLPFVRAMSEQKKQSYAQYARTLFARAAEAARQGECDVLILDEACAAANHGMIETSAVESFLAQKPERLEIVLTGRNPPESWLALADYVSQVRCVKHPYSSGIRARRGIEF